MAAQHNPLLVPGLLRPVAEHLTAMVQQRPGETRLDITDDDQDLSALPDGSVQCVTALFIVPSPALLQDIVRILDKQNGRIAWALCVDLPNNVRIGTRLHPQDVPPPLQLTTVRDVARFDGVAHYVAATGAAGSDQALKPYVAPDGTIRIPVEVLVLTR